MICTTDFFFQITRSSHPEVFCKKGAFENFTKFTGKHLCLSLFFNKVAGLGPWALLKKRLWHRWFLVDFVNFLRTSFFIEHLQQCLLITSREFLWGGDYMILFCKDEISTRPAGTNFTLRLPGEISFHPGKGSRFPTGLCLQRPIDSHWSKNVHKMMKFYKDIRLLLSHRLTSYES